MTCGVNHGGLIFSEEERKKIMKNKAKTQLFKWLISLFLLTSSCLTHVYTFSFFAEVPKKSTNVTKTEKHSIEAISLYHDYENDISPAYFHWIKLVFFVGFAFSHFTVGLIGDQVGKWKVYNFTIQILILAGILTAFVGKYYLSSGNNR